MPVLAKFRGVVIRFMWLGSLGARLHAFHGDSEVVVDVIRLKIIQGEAPDWVKRLVLAWARQHQMEVLAGVPKLAPFRTAFSSASAC